MLKKKPFKSIIYALLILILTFSILSCSTTEKTVSNHSKKEFINQTTSKSAGQTNRKKNGDTHILSLLLIKKPHQIEYVNTQTDSFNTKSKATIRINARNNYPNPFCMETVTFDIFEDGDVTFKLFNKKGVLVGIKIYPNLKRGYYIIPLYRPKWLKGGTYYYRLEHLNSQTKLRKIGL